MRGQDEERKGETEMRWRQGETKGETGSLWRRAPGGHGLRRRPVPPGGGAGLPAMFLRWNVMGSVATNNRAPIV